MRLYRVKLDAAALELHKAYVANGDIIDGYLAVNGKIQAYSIGEAKKKAYMWDGKTEHYKNPLLDAISTVSMTQIGEDSLVYGVKELLKGRECFTDTDLTHGETSYTGDVFNRILEEEEGLEGSKVGADKETLEQLELLASIIYTDYVQIVKA